MLKSFIATQFNNVLIKVSAFIYKSLRWWWSDLNAALINAAFIPCGIWINCHQLQRSKNTFCNVDKNQVFTDCKAIQTLRWFVIRILLCKWRCYCLQMTNPLIICYDAVLTVALHFDCCIFSSICAEETGFILTWWIVPAGHFNTTRTPTSRNGANQNLQGDTATHSHTTDEISSSKALFLASRWNG